MKLRLADIVDIRTGFPFRGKVIHDPAGTLAVVQMKDVDESAGLSGVGTLRIEDDPKRHRRHLLQRGDVLLQSRGHKFPCTAVDQDIHGIAALGLYVLRPSGAVLPDYLVWVISHPTTRANLQAISRGTYIPFLAKADLDELRVPVPPFAEQHRIAEIARLLRTETRLSVRLQNLRSQLVDATTWRAATAKNH